MKLYPYVAGADASMYDGSGLTPANNPGLEIPFLAVICLNFAQFTAAKSQPSLQIDCARNNRVTHTAVRISAGRWTEDHRKFINGSCTSLYNIN